ncbi:MAG: DUF2207 domain-containing protein [Patescibacteria group bacterium]|jgi:uncharacterized membrane protein
MRKIILGLALFLAVPLGVMAAPPDFKAEVPIQEERIQNFEVTADLGADRTLKVTEKIDYNFGLTPRHGIYRNIPETYIRDGMTYSLKYKIDQVLRDGQPEPYEQSRQGHLLTLKVGRSESTITGKHAYTIVYETQQAINFFDDGHSEFYWNVTGNDWQVGIGQASFFLKSPMGQATSTLNFTCFTGVMGSTEKACELQPKDSGYWVTVSRVLDPYEGMTVVFGFPKGVITPETTAEAVQRILSDNWVLFIPLIILALMLYFWATRGKDPAPETVIPQYEIPRGMSPIVLAGTLGNGSIAHRGITATIIEMARQDYLHIEYKTKKVLFTDVQDYTFIKRKTPVESAPVWEKTLWNGLFVSGSRERSTFDDLKDDKFYTDVQSATRQAEKELQKLNIFVASPYAVRAFYVAAAVIIFMVVRVLGGEAPIAAGAAFASAVIVVVVGWFMPRRTKEGTSIVAEVKGFKWFLSVTEEARLKFHNAPARTPEQFMDLLPAAIALGVEKEWAKQFEDLQMAPPEWAEGNAHLFTTLALANAISHMDSTSSSSVYSPPASTAGGGGSGFSGGGSGGGFGGGGGGSW